MQTNQSKIEKLISELCPNGVKFFDLGSLSSIETGTQLNKTELSEYGDYAVLNGGINPSGFYHEYNTQENTIAISQGGASAGYVNFVTKKFWAGAHCFVIKPIDKKINNRFLYFILKNAQDKLQNAKLGAGIPGLNKKELQNFIIPIPPIAIQEEIVKILNGFTELEAELEAELEVRKKQYEHYRIKLLNLNHGFEWKNLGEIAKKIYSGGTPKTGESKYWDGGNIPWMSSGEVNYGTIYKTENFITELGLKNSSAKYVPKNSIVIALAGQGKTRGKVARTRIDLTTNQSLAAITFDDSSISSDYVFHFLKSQYLQLRQVSSGDGTRGGLNLQMISNYKIPVPSLKEQKRIASILDKFDALVNDISIGLPAELNARRRQYEYYRNKLLTFKEK